ncbi:MAG: hypothetical protein AMXMBFR64_24320 [Myxococcales bacterium]
MRGGTLTLGAVALVCLTTTAIGAGRARWGGTLRFTLPAVEGFDPMRAESDEAVQLAVMVHQPLYALEGRASRPVLLRSSAPDGADLACTLADEARFHDGRPVTSEDVRWSLGRLSTAPAASPARVLASLLRVEVVDSARFVLRLKAPIPRSTLERLLALPQAAILPLGGDGHTGAGPFALQGGGDRAAILLPHLAHPDGRPFVDRVEVRWADHPAEAAERLFYGEADLSLRGGGRLASLPDVRRVDGPTIELVALWPSDPRRTAVPGALTGPGVVASLLSRLEREAVGAEGLLPGLGGSGPAPTPLGAVVIGLGPGGGELADVAAALRDVAIRSGGAGSRVGTAADVTLWLGIRRLSAPDPLAVALQALGAAGDEAAARDLVVRVTHDDDGAARRALGALVADGAVGPLLHLRRSVWVRGGLRDVRFDGHGALDLASAWWEGGR